MKPFPRYFFVFVFTQLKFCYFRRQLPFKASITLLAISPLRGVGPNPIASDISSDPNRRRLVA